MSQTCRSNFVADVPRVYTGANLMSHVIVEPVSGHRKVHRSLHRLVIPACVEGQLTED